MEERIPCKPIVVSDKFETHRADIYDYSVDTFGINQAERYYQKIVDAVDTLSNFYLVYPECRHIETKSSIYRNIILDSHLILYRITKERIEVLDILHQASSINKIRNIRKIRI